MKAKRTIASLLATLLIVSLVFGNCIPTQAKSTGIVESNNVKTAATYDQIVTARKPQTAISTGTHDGIVFEKISHFTQSNLADILKGNESYKDYKKTIKGTLSKVFPNNKATKCVPAVTPGCTYDDAGRSDGSSPYTASNEDGFKGLSALYTQSTNSELFYKLTINDVTLSKQL